MREKRLGVRRGDAEVVHGLERVGLVGLDTRSALLMVGPVFDAAVDRKGAGRGEDENG